MVAALFVETDGIYFKNENIIPYDINKDAFTYSGPYPVIAHPPCNLWGKFAKINYHRWVGEHNKPKNDGGKFKFALDCVRKYGGVLEHPAFTYAWDEYGLLKPKKTGWNRMSNNEWTCEIWQSAYGHKARKKTWLYYVGVAPIELNWNRINGTHQIGFYDQRGKDKNKPTISGKKASATPLLFMNDLYKLANMNNKEFTELVSSTEELGEKD